MPLRNLQGLLSLALSEFCQDARPDKAGRGTVPVSGQTFKSVRVLRGKARAGTPAGRRVCAHAVGAEHWKTWVARVLGRRRSTRVCDHLTGSGSPKGEPMPVPPNRPDSSPVSAYFRWHTLRPLPTQCVRSIGKPGVYPLRCTGFRVARQCLGFPTLRAHLGSAKMGHPLARQESGTHRWHAHLMA